MPHHHLGAGGEDLARRAARGLRVGAVVEQQDLRPPLQRKFLGQRDGAQKARRVDAARRVKAGNAGDARGAAGRVQRLFQRGGDGGGQRMLSLSVV